MCQQVGLKAPVLWMQVAAELLLDMYPIPISVAALEADLRELQASGFLQPADRRGTWAFSQVCPALHALCMVEARCL